MEKLPPRSETYYKHPLHGKTVSWQHPSQRPTKESSHVSFGDSLNNLELEDRKFVEWMKRNYIHDLEYIGIVNGVPYTQSSKHGQHPVRKWYNDNIGNSTDTYGGRYEYKQYQAANPGKGGHKPRSKKSYKKGFKKTLTKKTRKCRK